jgi:carbamoyltransferase
MTGMRHLTIAGGVALNCVANGRLTREQVFDEIWIQPAAGDAGGALGAALFVWHQLLDRPRTHRTGDSQRGSYLGPAFSRPQIEAALKRHQVTVDPFEVEGDLVEYVAELLADGNVVGWFQGRMEFGPRALGARSILGDPRSPTMQATMNRKIKFRESFRPFAPCVLLEYAHQWFELPTGVSSPYMMLVAPVAKQHRVNDGNVATARGESNRGDSSDLLARVNQIRSVVPAVTHVDYSSRVQTVDRALNPRLHRLLEAFRRRTGFPILVNTSMNVRGEPICCTPEDAIRCFQATDMDVLVLGDYVLHRTVRSAEESREIRERHLAAFQLD